MEGVRGDSLAAPSRRSDRSSTTRRDGRPWATMAVTVPIPTKVSCSLFQLRRRGVSKPNLRANDRPSRWRNLMPAIGVLSPTIIAGDFNATPDAASIRYLTGRQSLGGRSVHYHDAWEVAGEVPVSPGTSTTPTAIRNGRDYPPAQPSTPNRLRLYWVVVRPPESSLLHQVRGAGFDQPIDGVWVSDHYGVSVDLDIGMEPDSS